MNKLEGSAQERLKELFSKYPIPPPEVVIPILEKAGLGERELTTQIYNRVSGQANGIKEILGLKGKDMRTLAKVWEILAGFNGQKLQSIMLDESRFTVSISECPMRHVGDDISISVKGKFCDLICTTATKALMDTIIGQGKLTCSLDKALIEGASKSRITY